MSECKYPVSLSDVAHAHKLPPWMMSRPRADLMGVVA